MRVDVDDFEQRYRADPDPWRFATSDYELAKYAATIGHLRRERYRRCFEPGCSVGVLTAMLAGRADAVVACDASPSATAAARRRLAGQTHVDVVTAALPEWWPTGSFDLVVLSEFGYYWDETGLTELAEGVRTLLAEPAEVVAVHWRGSSSDHLLSGLEVHQTLAAVFSSEPRLETVRSRAGGEAPDQPGYLLQSWTFR